MLIPLLIALAAIGSSLGSGIAKASLLTEVQIAEWSQTKSSARLGQKAQLENQKLSESLLNEQYQPLLSSSVNLRTSQERPLNNFNPVLSPYEDWNVSVTKKTSMGLGLQAKTFGTKYSALDGSFTNASQLGASLGVELDLWKNFLGKIDQARLKSARAQKIKADLQDQVAAKKSEVELRKVYWSLVSLDQSIELANQLIKSAERQLIDTKNRSRDGAADRGEVARTQAQVESRKAAVLQFQYERAVLGQVLERNLQGFGLKDFRIDPAAVTKASEPIQKCISQISAMKEFNSKFSSYMELVKSLSEELESEMEIAERHAGIDLALKLQYQTTGVSNSGYSAANSNLSEERRGGLALGLELKVPLGKVSGESEKSLSSAKRMGIESQNSSILSDLTSTHETVLQSIQLLQAGLNQQQENSKNLDLSFRDTEKKYRQGRIPVATVVLEQDILFNSKLQEIATKRQISHVLLDYFSVFNQFPCGWNQLVKAE